MSQTRNPLKFPCTSVRPLKARSELMNVRPPIGGFVSIRSRPPSSGARGLCEMSVIPLAAEPASFRPALSPTRGSFFVAVPWAARLDAAMAKQREARMGLDQLDDGIIGMRGEGDWK